MSKNINHKQKGADTEFMIFGGSENEERKYRGNQEISDEAEEKIKGWAQKKAIGRSILLAFDLGKA